jgi:hypothetical protein
MKHQILSKFIEDNKHLAEQGSKKWLEERQYTIGGSEISTVIGKNKYSTIQNLIAQKIGISQFTGNTATRWGSLFEGMTELIFQSLFLNGNAIHSTGSVQNKEIEAHRYSPDGLCIMKLVHELIIVLLEFKSPLNSIPEGKVPAHYLPQVKAGLCTLDIVEKAIYVSNMFRKCSLLNLNFSPSYDKYFHKDERKKVGFTQAIACGIILFSIPGQNINDFLSLYLCEKEELEDTSDFDDISFGAKKHEFALSDDDMSDQEYADPVDHADDDATGLANDGSLTLLQRIHNNVTLFLNSENDESKYKMLDIGSLCTRDTEEWLQLYKPIEEVSCLKAKYIKPNLNIDAIAEDDNLYVSDELKFIKKKSYIRSINKKFNFEKTIEKYKINSIKKGHIPVAVLPWKLMKSDILVVEKDADFLNVHKSKIDKVAKDIKRIISYSSDLDRRAELFDEMYPGTKIVQHYWDSKPLSIEDLRDFI